MDDENSVSFKSQLVQEFVKQQFCFSRTRMRELYLASLELDRLAQPRSQVFNRGSSILSEFFQF